MVPTFHIGAKSKHARTFSWGKGMKIENKKDRIDVGVWREAHFETGYLRKSLQGFATINIVHAIQEQIYEDFRLRGKTIVSC